MRLVLSISLATLAACSSSPPDHPDDATPSGAAACTAVGSTFCQKMYSCYGAAEIAQYQLPATEGECTTQQNAQCSAVVPAPGYCKGHAQTSTSAATACAAQLDMLTCAELKQPASGTCKTDLCSM